MGKIWAFIKALVAGVLSLGFIIAVILAVYFGLEWCWDYAISRFGDFGIGFMTCATGVIVLLELAFLIGSFYKEFKPKENILDVGQKRTLNTVSKEEYEED